MAGLIQLIITVITVLIFARVIMSFIIPFAGAQPHPVLVSINNVVNQLTEPILGPIRRVLPSFGGLDFSPMVVLGILWLIRYKVVPALSISGLA